MKNWVKETWNKIKNKFKKKQKDHEESHYISFESHVWSMISFGLLLFMFGLLVGACSAHKEEPKPIKKILHAEVKKPVHNPVQKRKKFVPVRKIENNKSIWAGEGFKLITRLECNHCERACWYHEKDKGQTTCLGVSMRANPDFFVSLLNDAWHRCRNQGIIYDWTGKNVFGKVKDICYHFRNLYWQRYVKRYKNCNYTAMVHLADASILQGEKAAVKILQKSHGIKVDGIFGPQSLSMCQKETFDCVKYLEQREKTLRTYKDFHIFGKGWLKRLQYIKKTHCVREV